MKIENIEVYGFRRAFHGMRNPKESWEQSDSQFTVTGAGWRDPNIVAPENPHIGPKDLDRACRLIKAGTDHRKFMRQIRVWWDITVPRYAWQEIDTYKVSTTRNSCSTMHKLGHRPLTLDDFEGQDILQVVLDNLNVLGEAYRAGGCKDVPTLLEMKRHLPEAYLQMATYDFSYETGLAMYRSRHTHRNPEWSDTVNSICATLLRLPYMCEFIAAAEK